MYELSEEIKLDKNKKHNIDIVVDRLVVRPDMERRLTDSVETTLRMAEGLMKIEVINTDGENEILNFSDSFSCPDCGISIDEIEPRSFHSIIHLAHVHVVPVWDLRWNLIRI